MSFLATVGKDFKAVFAWLGGSAGKAVVTTVEGVAEGVATCLWCRSNCAGRNQPHQQLDG